MNDSSMKPHPEEPSAPPAGAHDERIAEALAHYLDWQAAGEEASLDRLRGLYPELGGELQSELATIACLDRVLSEPPAAPASPPSEPLPERLSGCRILGEIGAGGMGRVLLALDERLGRKVAIKTLSRRLRESASVRTRFMNEARAMARLNHPNVARIYSLGSAEEEPHFVMEYVEGTPLTETARAMSVRQKADLLREVALAVDFLHRRGIVHRDLKPANILVGPDLEPKVLDFGLARQVEDSAARVTHPGEILGTPAYFAPEQTQGGLTVDARTDVFALGAIFYEMLTGELPFPAGDLAEQLNRIRESDPVLPRRINRDVPGDVQNVCLKALEKKPADRYQSAHELAADLERFLAGEAVLASPSSYSRVMSGRIGQHLRELEGWKRDRILSDSEYDSFRRLYDRLIEREDAWIMEVRRLSLPQVTLYLGAWLLAVGAALVWLFRYRTLSGFTAIFTVALAAAPALWIGVRDWRRSRFRIAVAFLLAFCLLLPIFCVVTMAELGLFAAVAQGKEEWEFLFQFPSIKRTTNAQLWWALFVSLPAYYWLRRFTKSSVFSLVMAFMGALLCGATMLRIGMLEWLESDPGRVYFRLIPFALLFFAAGFAIERLRYVSDSRYFYPVAVVFTFIALSGVATFHEPYAEWLRRALPWTRGQIEYLFVINAGIYFALHRLCDHFPSAQLRGVAKAFRFVIPGHDLTSLPLLGLEATRRWQDSPADAGLRFEARTFEILLPAVACFFVFASISRQMKNYLATGLLFLAIGAVRLQQNWLKDHSAWPAALLLAGIVLMIGAANYASLRLALRRWLRRPNP